MSDFNQDYDNWYDAHGEFDPYQTGRDAWNWQQQKIEQLQAQIDWLLERVIVNGHGVALPSGNYPMDAAKSRMYLAKFAQPPEDKT